MIIAMTIRQTALLGIFTMLGGSILLLFLMALAIKYNVLGKLFPNSKKFPD